MEQNTHPSIDAALVGTPTHLAEGEATVELIATAQMAADPRGLVHGGFTFGLADYAAMLAVNDPNVVLGAAQTRFLAPTRVGERLEARARVTEARGKRRLVSVEVHSSGNKVFEGELTCFVLDSHVLDG